MSRPPPSQPQDLLEVNLAILEELGRSVRATGAELVLVDASETFASGMRGLHKELVALCQRAGFGYVPAYRAFAHAQGSGQTLRWAHDPHLNQMGNQVLGRALAHWMAKRTGLVAGETPT
jgi:hypothetical protein